MPTTMAKAVWALGVVSVTAVAALASEAPKLDSFWATSGITYVLAILSIVNLVGLIQARQNRPNEKAVEAATKETDRRFQELGNDLRECTDRISEAVGEMKERMEDHEIRIRKNTEDHVQSREDRRHLGQIIENFERNVERWRIEDRNRDDAQLKSTERILEAMVQLRGGKRD